jgi:hypothetical protein
MFEITGGDDGVEVAADVLPELKSNVRMFDATLPIVDEAEVATSAGTTTVVVPAKLGLRSNE